jgi:hypothetical protein
MYYGMETGITWGWIFPLICFGFIVLCMAGMIGSFLRGGRMGYRGWCGIRHPVLTKRRSLQLRFGTQQGSSIIPKSAPMIGVSLVPKGRGQIHNAQCLRVKRRFFHDDARS